MNFCQLQNNLAIKSPLKAFKHSLKTGRAASASTLATVLVCGQVENGAAVAPLNAISHIAWGEEAFGQEAPSIKYTLTGLLLNDSAMVSWAMLHEMFFGRAKDDGNWRVSLLGGGVVSLAAYITDYHLVPERLKPGFEKHLKPRSLLAIYIVLALVLGLADSKRRK